MICGMGFPMRKTMKSHYIVDLSADERKQLQELISAGKPGARTSTRARILLLADEGWKCEEIAAALSTSPSTVGRVRKRLVEEGMDTALYDRPRKGGARKLSGTEEALLVATACSAPPEGSTCWTLELLADEMVRLTSHDSISRETVRRRLKDNKLKPWRREMWCIPKVNTEYIARMEDVLDLYAEPVVADDPIVSFDESPKQLISEVRTPVPAIPGHLERYDYEYKRNGTANLFVFVGVGFPWRHVKVTDRRTKVDFAECMRDLVDVHFPAADRIRVVLDNLNTHRPGSLYEAYPPEEARRILRRIEFHYTPKHASWLNMVEIEIGVLNTQCLSRRIGDKSTLIREITAWQKRRNASGAKIQWMFSTENARRKLTKMYAKLPAGREKREAA